LHQVISQFSGFGRTGAMRSMRWQSLFAFDNVNKSAIHGCAAKDHVTIEETGTRGHAI
jgi:hypothetical protein